MGCAAFLQSREDFAEAQSSWARCCSLVAAPWAGVTKVLLPQTYQLSRAGEREQKVPTVLSSPCPQAVPTQPGTQPMGMHFQSFRFISTFHSFLQQHQHTGLLSHLFPSSGDAPVVPAQLCCRSLQTCKHTSCLPAHCPCLRCGLQGAREGKNTVLRAIASACCSKTSFKTA